MRKLIFAILLIVSPFCFAEGLKLSYERIEGGINITGHGTAFGIGKRLLLTAAHNVLNDKNKPYETVYVKDAHCKVLHYSLKYDLALLQSEEDVFIHELGNDAAPNDNITMSGSKRGRPITLYTGKIVELNFEGFCRDKMLIDFDHGDSGAPIMKDDKVVGIAVAGVPKDGDLDHTVGLFIRASIIKEFLNEKE